MPKKPTLIDVGIDAGVSAITVSRALRQPEKVSESLRAKVTAAVERLGYFPDSAASILASKRSNIIGMIVPSFSNAVFSDVLGGAFDTIDGSPYTIQIGNAQYSPLAEEKMIPGFLNLKPAGLIIAGTDQTSKTLKLLSDVDFPVVQVMDISDDPIDIIVGFSNFDGASEAVEHMIAQGYRAIGFAGARMDPRSQKRLAGYKAAMEKHGLYNPKLISTTQTRSSPEVGGHLVADILQRAPQCDGLFCNNDDLAIGAFFECQRRNIKIPKEFGICGFNDLGTTSQMYPPVTSVFTKRYEIGTKAVQMILDSIKGKITSSEKIVDLGYKLQKRESTMCRG